MFLNQVPTLSIHQSIDLASNYKYIYIHVCVYIHIYRYTCLSVRAYALKVYEHESHTCIYIIYICVCVCVCTHIHIFVCLVHIYIHDCRLASRLVCIFCHKYRSLSIFSTRLLLSKLLFQGRICFLGIGIWEPMTTFNIGLWVRYPSCLERIWTTICIWV